MITPMVEGLARLRTRLVPLFPTWKSAEVFKPLDTIANLLGLCRFYQTNLQQFNMLSLSSKSAAGTHRIKHLLELAKDLGRPLMIVVFEGANITPLGLLQELALVS